MWTKGPLNLTATINRIGGVTDNRFTPVVTIPGMTTFDFALRLQPKGRLVSVRLTRSSGSAAWDDAAERAIRRTDPFPCPTNGACPAEMELTHGPRD